MSKEVEKEVYFNLLPTKDKERVWGFWDFLAVQICFGIAAWFFLVGGFTGLVLPAKWAIPTVIFGNQFPLFLMSILSVYSARYGAEQFYMTRPMFGSRGTDIWILIYIVSSYGWIAYASFLFGESAYKFAAMLKLPEIIASEVPGAIIWAFIATIIGMYIAYKGPTILKWFMRLSAIFLIAVLLGFIYYLIAVTGLEKIFALQPSAPYTLSNGEPDWPLNFAAALEWNVGLGFSWAFWYGQYTRLAKTESAAYHGTLWGWGVLAATAGVFSALTALIVGSFDPTDWIVKLGTFETSLIGLLLMAIANITSVAALVYPLSITLRSRVPRIKWIWAVLIVSLPALLIENPTTFASYNIYLTYIALITGIYAGVLVGEYILTRGNYRIRDIYNYKGFWYTKGFNLAGCIAAIAATAFYLWTWDPVLQVSHNGLFDKISAGIPSFFVAMILYIILSKIMKIR